MSPPPDDRDEIDSADESGDSGESDRERADETDQSDTDADATTSDTDQDGDDDSAVEPSAAEFDAPTDADGGHDVRHDTAGAQPTPGPGTAETTSESLRRTLDGVLPEADVDSRWWYWVAAVPVYFLVTLVGGAIAAAVFVFAGLLDIAGFGGLASVSTFVLFGGFAALFGLVGLVIAVLFPVGIYVDARAIEATEGAWTPDPVLWGLLAVVAVLVTNFIVSVPLALYYLYRRHEAIGTP